MQQIVFIWTNTSENFQSLNQPMNSLMQKFIAQNYLLPQVIFYEKYPNNPISGIAIQMKLLSHFSLITHSYNICIQIIFIHFTVDCTLIMLFTFVINKISWTKKNKKAREKYEKKNI